ncbi:uncharacterized protein LOC113231854 [Hyposmocoma kahamanoa]|uniref:uncharacterized protein LOC113231854 n=1 Tax=Hyposmocoma kahamanoa TaxID=1477025 RepID=UPI000E6D7677|nr:uncharacterized protein LOC113231854 [Hyposmocoma kahamanoa]
MSLADSPYGDRTMEAIHPVLDQYRFGHGCFGHYLHKVAKREASTSCHECGDADNTAQHTLEVCNLWSAQRRTLVATIGGDLSLLSVVSAMQSGEESWEAVAFFCEEVILQKEAAERVREDAVDANPLRRRRWGRRRVQFAARLIP